MSDKVTLTEIVAKLLYVAFKAWFIQAEGLTHKGM